ncbi:MAG: hypothetical protein V4605_10515 [Pseudomonadota bacterium]
MFSQSVIEKLDYYVYFLRDPINMQVFYIGKGNNNRVFNHVACAISDPKESDKLNRIREISKLGKNVEHFILRHGLSERSAFEVEAAIIDFIGISKLSNLQNGHYSTDFGIKSTDEVIAMYSAPAFETDLPVILININKLYDREMSADDVYESTRKSWVVGKTRNKAEFAVATYRGLTREVYKIEEWYPIDDRWGFNGKLADADVRDSLRYKSLVNISKRGASNPIRYLNCNHSRKMPKT